MKRFLTYCIIPAFVILVAVACDYKDEGNYDYVTLPDFTIDTTGLQTSFTVTQFSNLKVAPGLIFGGDKSKLEYRWEMYKTSSASYNLGPSTINTGFEHNYTKDDFRNFVIAETAALDMTIPHAPDNYYLQYTVFNPENKQATIIRFTVTVEGAFGRGLLVFYQKNGVNDCDFIKTKLFDATLTGERVMTGVYTMANPDRPLAGNALDASMMVNSKTNHVHLLTDQDAVKLLADDLTVSADIQGDLFFERPETIMPQAVFSRLNAAGTSFTAKEAYVNDGSAYFTDISWGQPPLRIAGPAAGAGIDYYAAPFPLLVYQAHILYYDQKNKRFLYVPNYTGSMTRIGQSDKSLFDLDDVGKDLVYMDYGYNTHTYTIYAIFREPVDDGTRWLYIIDAQSAPASYRNLAKIDISACPGIAQATLFEYGSRGPVIHYASEGNLYRLRYSFDSSPGELLGTDVAWSAPTGEVITSLRYMRHAGFELDESAMCKYLMIGTYNESTNTGTLHILEINYTSGTVVKVAETHTGMGRIAEVVFKQV